MNGFQAALQSFLAGTADFSQLDAALDQALAADPASGPAIFAAIEEVYRSGRLPLQLYVMMKNKVAAGPAAAPRPPPQSPPPPPPGPADEPDDDPADRTNFRPGAPPAGPPHQTGAPHTGQHTGAGPQTGQHTGQHTGAGPQTGTGQHTGAPRTGTGSYASSWSSISSWSKGEAQTLETGTILKGRFALESVVGRGGMGVVFRARDLLAEEMQDRNPYVAIKVLNDEFRRHPDSLMALQRESRKAQNLAHPNIATVFNFDRDEATSTVYIHMEFLDGDSLDRVVKNRTFEGMPVKEALPLIEGLGRALSYAHSKGIVHSDFKPGNCFLTKSGVIKVFDFGIARAAKIADKSESELTRFDPGTLGALTMGYASAEMIDGEEPDPRDDIYALGCVSYEILTGRHPFNKKPATEARDAGLVPPPIKGLNRSQTRALNKSLAFNRKDRSTSVDEFLDEISGNKLDIPIIGGVRGLAAAAAIVLILVVGAVWLPGYLEQRGIDNLIANLSSGDSSLVSAGIEDFLQRDANVQGTVLQQVRDSLTAYFETAIGRAVDRDQNRYDYPAAARLLDEAERIFPDSATFLILRETVETDLNALRQELDRRFNETLQAQQLLPDADADDIPEVLALLAEADPENPLLADPRLVVAYADAAEAALAMERYSDADNLIAFGLERYPDNGRLAGLNETLTAALESQAGALRVSELLSRIGSADQLENLDDARELQPEIAELGSLLITMGQSVDQFDRIQDRIAQLVGAGIDQNMAAREWTGADRLLNEFSDTLRVADYDSGRARVAAARDSFNGERDSIMAGLTSAADSGQMDAAIAALESLEAIDADPATVQRARLNIERGYRSIAFDARTSGDLDRADAILLEGLAFADASEILLNEQREVTRAREIANQQDAEARSQQLAADIDSLTRQIEVAFEADAFSLADADSVIDDIQRLGTLQSDNALAVSGPAQVASRLAASADALAGQQQFDEALAMLEAAAGRVGNADVLAASRGRIEASRDAYEASQRETLIAEQRGSLNGLLDAPQFNAAWENEVRGLLDSLGRLLPDGDATVGSAAQRAAEAFVAEAASLRGRQRLDDARNLLASAERFSPGLEAIAGERAALDQARGAIAAERQLAEVQGLKQSFVTDLAAGDPRAAEQQLADLRNLLPANDQFLVADAPRAFAEYYEELAREALEAGSLDQAGGLVEQGLARDSGYSALTDLRAQISAARDQRLDQNVALLTGIISGGPYDDATRANSLLSLIASDAGDEYPAYEQNLRARVTQLATGNSDAAVAAWASALFPDIVIERAAPARGKACTADLAGLGARGSRAQCYDEFGTGSRGPILVVVPAGGPLSGPVALGRYEILVRDWNVYCELSNRCDPRTDPDDLPLTNVSYAGDVSPYLEWLSNESGNDYRLPTRAEWQYVANSSEYAQNDHQCAGRGTPGLRGIELGADSAWGIKNLIGNVQEWVSTGDGVEARGGSFQTPLGDCDADTVAAHAGTADADTGLRVVRNLSAE